MSKKPISFKVKTALVVSAVTATLLVLPVFLSPIYGEEVPWDSRKVFLEEGQALAVKMDVEDTAHMLGEEFGIAVTIQYDSDVIEVNIDGLRDATFNPFDVVGGVEIVHTRVENPVYEYRYSTKLVAVGAIPGKAYLLNPVLVEYTVLETGEKKVFNVIPKIPFQVGSYYGGKTEGVEFLPPKPAVEDNTTRAKIMLGISGILFMLIAGAILAHTYFAKNEETEKEPVVSDADALTDALKPFYNRSWLEQESADVRLLQLEPLVYRAAHLFFGLSPTDLYKSEKEHSRWQTVLKGIDSAYAHQSATHDKVEEVVHELDLLLRIKRTRKEGR